MDTLCRSLNLKNQDDRGMQHRVTGLSFPYRGPKCEAPRIELHSTESRCEAPWIEVRSTEAFLLNWGDASGIEVRITESRREAPWIEVRSTEAFLLNWGDAQTWLGQLLVGI